MRASFATQYHDRTQYENWLRDKENSKVQMENCDPNALNKKFFDVSDICSATLTQA